MNILVSVRMSAPISPRSESHTCLEVSSQMTDPPTAVTLSGKKEPRFSRIVPHLKVSSESPSTLKIRRAEKIATPVPVAARPYKGLGYGLKFPSSPEGNDSSGTPDAISSNPE